MKHRQEYPLTLMTKVLKVSKSGYYEFLCRKESSRSIENKQLSEEIYVAFTESNSTYGSLRVQKAIGQKCSRAKVARLMKAQGLASVWRKKYKPQTTVVDATAKFKKNVVNQDFAASYVGQKVGCDITYIPTKEGFLYLAVVLDFFSRKILGFAFSDSLESSIVSKAFLQAVGHYGIPKDSVYHSDRGCQYTAQQYMKLLESMGITQSMSRKGNCYDNAMTESFFATLKVELVDRYTYYSRSIAEADIKQYLHWYNEKRLHSSINYLCPKDFIETKMAS
jgi:putative transposase